MPWTFAAFGIGALSMIGLPPAAGFVSKWYLVSGALEAGHWLALGVIVASTLLNAGYFLPILYRAFFKKENGAAHGEAPLPMVLALVATAALTVLMFFYAELPLALAKGMLG